MIEAGEVGAVFTISDEASAVLTRLAEQFERLDAIIGRVKEALATFKLPPGVNAQLTRLNERLDALPASAEKAMTGISGSFDKIDASVMGTQERVVALKAEMAGLRMPALLPAGVGGGGAPPGVRAGAEGPEGPRISRWGGLPLGGGYRLHGGGMAAMGAAAALGYGIYEEAEVEAIIAKAMMTGQLKVDAGMTDTDAFKQMRDVIQRVSSKTGFGPLDVGQALLTTERQFGGLSFSQRLGLEETLIPFAAAEARMKETSLPEAFEAMVGLAHMTGTYDPKQLPELMREFSYASMITPVPIPRFQRAISYSLPMLHAGLDMDPAAVMFLTAMTQTAGITNTKSGTWLRSFFENAEPRIGTSKTDLAHNEALRKMGLLDQGNHVTWQILGANGKTDWDKSIVRMSEVINKFTQSVDPAERLGLLKQAFGERGGGEAALMNLTQFIDQMPVLQAKMKAFMGGDNILDSLLAGSTAQKADVAWAQTQNVLMDIGSTTLPIVNSALNAFNALLKGLQGALGQNIANPLIGGAALGGVGAWLFPNALKWLFNPWVAGAAAAGFLGYEATKLPTLEDTKRIMAAPDPGYAARKRLDDILNPITPPKGPDVINIIQTGPGHVMRSIKGSADLGDVAAANRSLAIAGYTPQSLASEMSRETARANALTNLGKIGDQIQGMLEKIPSQVQPAIANLASVGNQIAAAINGMAASARNAAAAIPTGAVRQAVTVRTAIDVSGRQLAEVVSYHQIRAVETASNAGYFDGSSLPSPTDLSYT